MIPVTTVPGKETEATAVAFATLLRYCPVPEPILHCSDDPVTRHGSQFLRMGDKLKEVGLR